MNLNILKQIPGINKNFKIKDVNYLTKIIIIDDFFVEPFYEYLNSKTIQSLTANAKNQPVNKKDIKCDFDIDESLEAGQKEFANFFTSKIWQKAVQEATDVKINEYTSIFTNCLKPETNRGLYAGPTLCSVLKNEQQNNYNNNDNMIIVGKHDESYDIDYDDKDLNKIIKSVSAIYFSHPKKNQKNASLDFCKGHHDTMPLKIEAKANRLVLFELTPDSYHRITNTDDAVLYIQQYFHSNPSYFFNKNLDKIYETKILHNLPFVDRINDSKPMWNIENDSEYKEYFSTLTTEKIFKNSDIRRLLVEKFNLLNKELKNEKEILEDTIIRPANPLGVFKTKLPEEHRQRLKDLFISNLDNDQKFYVGKIELGKDMESFLIDKINLYQKMLGHNFYYQKNDPSITFQSQTSANIQKKEIIQHKKHLNIQKVTLWRHDETKGYQKFAWTDIIDAKLACVIYLDLEEEGAPTRFYNIYLHPDKYNTKQHEPGRTDNIGEWLFFSSPTKFTVYANDMIIYPGAIIHEIAPIKPNKERLIITIGLS